MIPADPDQLVIEQARHLAEFSYQVASAGFAWIDGVNREDHLTTWSGLDPELRLVLAQEWVGRNPSWLIEPSTAGLTRDDLAHALAVEYPVHPLWPHCQRVSMRTIRTATAGWEHKRLAQTARTRPLIPGIEVVNLIDLDALPTDNAGRRYHPGGTPVPALPLVMHLDEDDEWKVLGIGARTPTPGWPPTWTDVPAELLR